MLVVQPRRLQRSLGHRDCGRADEPGTASGVPTDPGTHVSQATQAVVGQDESGQDPVDRADWPPAEQKLLMKRWREWCDGLMEVHRLKATPQTSAIARRLVGEHRAIQTAVSPWRSCWFGPLSLSPARIGAGRVSANLGCYLASRHEPVDYTGRYTDS